MAMREWCGRVCWLAAGLLLPLQLQAALSHLASSEWQSLRSNHFLIHFAQGEEAAAREVLAMAETVHLRLANLILWEPEEPTEIVLSDEADSPNGWATAYPGDRMQIYLAPPDEIGGLEDHAGWLELVFTHEYLHVLHLDKAVGPPSAMREIFGRHWLLFPNALQPSWLIEGLATHVETDLARGIGRGQSSYFEMMMRMEALSGMKPLRQVNQPLVSWPMGDVPYLYGVYFYRWLAERYGKAKVWELVDNYSANLIPFRIGSNAAEVTGKDLDALWLEFSSEMRNRFAVQQEKIEARGLTQAQRLSNDGYFAGPLVAGDGGDLYYVAFDAVRRPALLRQHGELRERLATVSFGARLDYHSRQGLLVAQPESCGSAAHYYDLYRYDRNGRETERLTHCGRYRNALWSADGNSILAVHQERGISELHLLDLQGRLLQRLWRGTERQVPGEISLSPDGRLLAATLWQPGQGWELALFDLQTRQWQVVSNSRAIEGLPRFAEDGRSLLFSADYDGVYNLYSLDLTTQRLQRLSNVVGGAFYPLRSGNELYYLGYSGDGFDLYRTPYQPRSEPVSVAEGSGAVAATAHAPDLSAEPRPYTPWHSVRPRWWLPHLYLDDQRTEVGAMSAGSDTLQRHLYAVDLAFDTENRWAVGSVDYIYDRWYPIFKLHGDSYPLSLLNSNGDVLKVRRESSAVAEVVVPFFSRYRKWALHVGAVEQKGYDLLVNYTATAYPATTDYVAGVAVSFDSATTMPRSVSRSDGREILLVAEDSDLLKGGDYRGRALLADWREFIRIGGEHVVALRAVAAKGDEGSRAYNLGGIARVSYLPLLLDTTVANAPFNRRSFALRGYAEGLPQLSGNEMRLASLEYRFPLWRVERGFMAPPLGLHQLHGALFGETGSAWWTAGTGSERYYSSYGAELGADSVLFYSLPLRIMTGYAHGVDKIGGDYYYLRLGTAF